MFHAIVIKHNNIDCSCQEAGYTWLFSEQYQIPGEGQTFSEDVRDYFGFAFIIATICESSH